MYGFMGDADQERFRKVYQSTDIRRVPVTGIVSGYHTLPFTLVGPNDGDDEDSQASAQGSVKLTGKINVSPKLILSISPDDERFNEIFPESEPFMDKSIVGRVFSFSAANKKNYRIRNEFLSIEEFPDSDRELLDKVLEEMNRAEIINTGVIWCPQPKLYPISLERFIFAVIERELR